MMKEYMSKKTAGFYLTILAAILAVIGIINYSFARSALGIVFGFAIAAVVVEVLLIVLSKILGNKWYLDLSSTVCAVLMMIAVAMSLTNQVESLGFFIVGMYSLRDVLSLLLFVGFGLASVILFTVASFMKLGK